MRYIVGLMLVLSLPLFARAEDKEQKPNVLTPKEIADGWILLFDGKTTFGWTSPNGSKWTIADGMLAPQKEKPGLLVTTCAFSHYELVVEFRQAKDSTFRLHHCCNLKGEPLDASGRDLKKTGDGWWRYHIEVSHHQLLNESLETLGTRAGASPVVSREVLHQIPRPPPAHIALMGNSFVVRAIKLLPRKNSPLFNGKDFDGWKEHPNRKSKFSVSKEGWLSLKDGPGDLQTTGEWADFILQLDCKTNGKNLNSGVFFRCLPGQYQMGYEAQIHNGFGPEKEYTLDIHEPKKNQLLEKKKEKFTALDYGTGAIYRRMPARFQAAQDNEWFTMTVAARGRHLATWVNGIQTVDWTDNRPLEENARKGAYLKKGPISIQGHDPTTDLLFRNFRIAELPAK